jgi:hypothetical protein
MSKYNACRGALWLRLSCLSNGQYALPNLFHKIKVLYSLVLLEIFDTTGARLNKVSHIGCYFSSLHLMRLQLLTRQLTFDGMMG